MIRAESSAVLGKHAILALTFTTFYSKQQLYHLRDIQYPIYIRAVDLKLELVTVQFSANTSTALLCVRMAIERIFRQHPTVSLRTLEIISRVHYRHLLQRYCSCSCRQTCTL